MREDAYVARPPSEPGRPEPREVHAADHQPTGYAGEVGEREHHFEEPAVELRREQQEQQDQESPLLGGLQGSLRLGAQVRLERAVAVQPWDRQDVEEETRPLAEA